MLGRARNDWIVTHALPDDPAAPTRLISNGYKLRWTESSLLPSVARGIENRLPELRRRGYLSLAERRFGISLEKSSARDELSKALQELADVYEAIGDQKRSDATYKELTPLLTESPTIRSDRGGSGLSNRSGP